MKTEPPDYFDIECDGLSTDSVIFHANLNGKLVNRRQSERHLLIEIISWLWEHEHGPPIMGKNLIFDLKHIQARLKLFEVKAHLLGWQAMFKNVNLKEVP